MMNIVTGPVNKNRQLTIVMHRYIAMYTNGLDTPIEIAFHSDQVLDEEDTKTLKIVEAFILRSVDIDLRELHFIFKDARADSNIEPARQG